MPQSYNIPRKYTIGIKNISGRNLRFFNISARNKTSKVTYFYVIRIIGPPDAGDGRLFPLLLRSNSQSQEGILQSL